MQRKLIKVGIAALGLISLFSVNSHPVLAHEAYVLSKEQFNSGLQQTSLLAFSALLNPDNVRLMFLIGLGITVVIIASIFFWRSRFGKNTDQRLKSLSEFGPVIIRITIGLAFFASASTNSFLGPELSLQQLPYSQMLQIALYVISAMILFGFAVEWAAIVALVIFTTSFFYFGIYLATYLNYLGEIVVLLLFGSRFLSIDRFLRGTKTRFQKLLPYEPLIIRVTYGAALIFTAVEIKLLHPVISLTVISQYHLTQFWYLFPPDPVLIVLGAGLTEVIIGLFFILGFQTRLTVAVTLFYITLSLLFFREAVWPHLLLYGISISLFLNNGGPWTLDEAVTKFKFSKNNS